MEIVIAAAVLAVGLVVAALLLVKRAPGLAAAGTAPSAAPRAAAGAKEAARKAETDDALARRQEIGRLEERLTVARGGPRRLAPPSSTPAPSKLERAPAGGRARPTSATSASSSA